MCSVGAVYIQHCAVSLQVKCIAVCSVGVARLLMCCCLQCGCCQAVDVLLFAVWVLPGC